MKESILWTCLQQLQAKELRQLEHFILSPFFNRRKDVIDLYGILLEHRRHAKSAPTHEFVARRLWPGDPFDAQRLRYMMSFLADLIKQYLAHQHLKDNELQLRQSILKEAHARGMDNLFDQTNRRLKHLIDALPAGIQKLRETHYLNEVSKENYYHRQHFAVEPLAQLNDSLDENYIVEKLRIYIEAASLASRQSSEFKPRFQPAMLQLIRDHQKEFSPLVQLYHFAYQALASAGDVAAYKKARSLLVDQENSLSPVHLRELYLLTINYGIKQMNRGNEPFFRETFDLYRSGLNNGALLEEEMISASTYKNITAVGLRLGEQEWVLAFLHRYKPQLMAKNRDQVFRYNMAIYQFHVRDYAAFVELVQQFKSRDIHVNCDIRRMYAIMFYEHDDWDVLEHYLSSFKGYLVRHRGKLSYHFRNWNQFIRMMTKLIKATHQKDLESKLKTEIKELEYLSSKEWFLKQLGDA